MARGLLVLTSHDPKGYPGVVVGLAQSLFVKLILAMLFVALIDLVYSRWEFTRQMHMSRREVRDELKHREGDPRIRQKLRQLRVELLKRTRALRSVPGSDVIITNPTHIAVAVRYREEEGRGPKLLAKGAGDLALRMRRIAQRHGIPIVENRRLARALFREVDFDAFVPEQWYPEVARILVWVYLQRERQSQTRSLA
jgi:flagellar biosynthetic protein FlhB